MAVGRDAVDHPSIPQSFQIERGESGEPWLRYALVEYWRSLTFVLRNGVPSLVNVSYQLVMLRMLELTWLLLLLLLLLNVVHLV